jgi:hypothetical protein
MTLQPAFNPRRDVDGEAPTERADRRRAKRAAEGHQDAPMRAVPLQAVWAATRPLAPSAGREVIQHVATS